MVLDCLSSHKRFGACERLPLHRVNKWLDPASWLQLDGCDLAPRDLVRSLKQSDRADEIRVLGCGDSVSGVELGGWMRAGPVCTRGALALH